LNGIGPAEELQELDIPVVRNLPGVGKQLSDHCMAFMCAEVDTEHNNRYAFESNPEMVMEAEALWKQDYTGNLALFNSGLWGGFLKLPELEDFPEFQALDKGIQEYLSKDKVPTYEFGANMLMFPPGMKLPESSSYLTTIAFLMNPQSRGSVVLRSSNPQDKPVIELGFLEHPYDRRILREAIRNTWTKVYENPLIKKHVKNRLYGPESLSAEHIDDFMREATTTVWHGNGTQPRHTLEANC
jgi:choline dehydrogenase-like flavoprotein